jgi:hypothetical protein
MASMSVAGRSVTIAGAARLLLVAVGLIAAASAVYVIAVPVDPGYFPVPWEQFRADNPAVAEYLVREERLLGVMLLGFGLLTAAIAWRMSPSSEARPGRILWVVPLVFAATTAVILPSGFAAVIATYVVLAVLAALAVAGMTARRTGD